MKICFIGVGSIAKRHIQNTYEIFQRQNREVLIDIVRSGKGIALEESLKKIVRRVYWGNEQIEYDYDAIFITNPTHLHYNALKTYELHGKAFFIEKPVFNCGDIDINSLNLDCSKVYYVACPLRYTSVIQYLKQTIDFSQVYDARVISSSYLPEWRPNVDYRKTYSARKEMGGGVGIDLIHEWDYLTYLMGMPEKVMAIQAKLSNLQINSNDIAVYIAKYKDKIAELHLDYFGRKPIREIQLFMKEDTLLCDMLESTILFMKSGKKIEFHESRNEYQLKELEHFFGIIESKFDNENGLYHACEVLKLSEGNVT